MVNKILLALMCLVVLSSCSDDVKNKKPVIERIITDLSVITPNDTTFIKCNAYDPDGDDITFQWMYDNQEIRTTSNTIPFVPDNSLGYHNIKCIVSDSKSTSEKSITLLVVGSYSDTYYQGILDAQTPELSEIYSLTPITIDSDPVIWEGIPGNSRILITTFTQWNQSYEPYINDTLSTWWGDTWICVGNELKNTINNNIVTENRLNLRIKQLLGLPSTNNNQYIIELWVYQEDLFRPSKDPEINDSFAQLDFPANVSQDHINWFNQNVAYSYTPNGYPWTQLGYTYDWGNPSIKKGLSEYILKRNSNVIVKSVQLTNDFFNPTNK